MSSFLSSPPLPSDWESRFRGLRVLVTGGLGFIGSNLVRRLIALEADVLVVDSLIPAYGGNPFNLHGVEDRARINIADVRDGHAMARLVQERDLLFNLAGQVSHVDSMEDPFTDLEINCRSQLSILEACRRNNPSIRVIYAGTRQQYGRPRVLPVDENHLLDPSDVNGINKTAGEAYHLVYHRVHGIRAASLRLTNSYGPGLLLRHGRQGFFSVFLRTALEGGEIKVYGTGEQLRDMNYVDDVADAFLRAGIAEWTGGEAYNLGGDEARPLAEIAAAVVRAAGKGSWRLVPFPEDARKIDIGSYYGSYAKIREALGWRPKVGLEEGLSRTVEYYRKHLDRYVP